MIFKGEIRYQKGVFLFYRTFCSIKPRFAVILAFSENIEIVFLESKNYTPKVFLSNFRGSYQILRLGVGCKYVSGRSIY